MDVIVEWEETHEYHTKISVDEEKIRAWLIESGPASASKEITGEVVKEFLESNVDGFEPEPEDFEKDFYDTYGRTITRVGMPDD